MEAVLKQGWTGATNLLRVVGGVEIREDFLKEEAPELVLKKWQELAESTKLCQDRREKHV